MKVKYIGNHPKTDSIPGVGLMWMPGQEREVTSTVSAHLLAYPDTWVKGDEESDQHVNISQDERRVKAGDRPEAIGFLEKDKTPEEPLPVVNFHAMTKDQLQKFAEDHLTEKLPKNLTEDVLRERVTKAWTKRQTEDKTGG